MPTLVATADDVGLVEGMTNGAVAAFDSGLVRACSVVACGPAFDHAVPLLRARPGLDVGVHLTLVGARPLSPPEEVPSLIGRNGAFLPGWGDFVARTALGGIDPRHVLIELRRQVERVRGAGLAVVHLNSHQHLHVLPTVLDAVGRLAEEFAVPFIRLPGEPVRGAAPRALAIRVLAALSRRARRRVAGSRVRAVDRSVGVAAAGHLDPGRILDLIGLVDGVSELICHPGLGDAELERATGWGYRWDAETAALCDPRLQAALADRGIAIASFSGLR